MGDVYLGYEEALQRRWPSRCLPAELGRDEDFVRRFHAEATAVAKLTHPNIVPIYFIGQDAGCHFFAMQYVEGESLDRLLARRSRLGVDETLDVLGQCLAGLGAAHQAGLVHRDVKPGNVLLDAKTGRALVADFGLVKTAGDGHGMTATGVVLGTLDYIAPEQARGRTWTAGPTCTRWECWPTRCSAAGCPFGRTRPAPCSFSTPTRRRRRWARRPRTCPGPLAASWTS